MKKGFIILFILTLFLEIFVFNYKSYRVLSSKNEIEFSKKDFSLVEQTDEYKYVEIENIDAEVKTLHIFLDNVTDGTKYEVFYTDETSSGFRYLGTKNYAKNVWKSTYLDTYLSGKSNKMGIKIYDPNASIEKININEKIPFEFNIYRFIILYFILVSIYAIKKGSIFKVPYSQNNFKQEIVLFTVLAVFSILIVYINTYSEENSMDFYSYNFVKSISDGKIDLGLEPSEKLLNLENPYDTTQRSQGNLRDGKDYIWDSALYNQKFYVYFGILPALILLVPFHLLTNLYLSCASGILIFSVLTGFALKKLIENIFTRYFSNIPFKFMLYSFLILLFGSQILVLNGIPRMYEFAIISGMFFAVMGINFVFEALKTNNVKYRYVLFSSLFLSLAVACRPTMLLVSLIALPFYIKILKENIKQKNGIIKSICTISIPYIVIGGLLMYYNYIRFGSIFEFGASYQMTVNNMLNLKNRFMSIGTGLVCNLFGIPIFMTSFPFMVNNHNLVSFYGYYYVENMIGGLFMLAPICFYIFGIKGILKKSRNKKTCYAILIFSVVGLIICILSTMIAGSVPRYLCDYSWILIIAGIMSFMELYNSYKSDETRRLANGILKIFVIYIVFVNLCGGFVSEGAKFQKISPEEFYDLKYNIDFWE